MVNTDERRARLVRDSFAAIAEEMIRRGPTKSGAVSVHYQNGVPRVVEWGPSKEPIEALLTPTPDPL